MAWDTTENGKMQVIMDAIPVVRASGTAIPEFMIKIDDVLSSSMGTTTDDNSDDLSSFAELLWFHSIEERMTAGHVSGDLKGTSTVKHSLFVAHLLNDSWMPTLRKKMRNGENISEVSIVRLMNLGESNENYESYKTTFTDCKIDRVEEYPDRLILSIRVKERADSTASISQDSTPQGTADSADWDYSTATDNNQ